MSARMAGKATLMARRSTAADRADFMILFSSHGRDGAKLSGMAADVEKHANNGFYEGLPIEIPGNFAYSKDADAFVRLILPCAHRLAER